jgi:hypothetical protein
MSEYLGLFSAEEQETILHAFAAIEGMKTDPAARQRHEDFVRRRDGLISRGENIRQATVTALMDDPEADAAALAQLDARKELLDEYGLLARQVSDIDFYLTMLRLKDEPSDGEYFDSRSEVFQENFFAVLGTAYYRGLNEGYSADESLHSTRMAAEIIMLELGLERPGVINNG